MSHANAQHLEQYVICAAKATTFPRRAQVHKLEQIKGSSWYTTAIIQGVEIKFKLVTGAEVNVLPLSIVQKSPGPVTLQPTSTVLVAFEGTRSTPKGVVSLKCKTDKATATLQFYVSDQSDMPILSRAACEELQLVKRIELLARKSASTKEELIKMHPLVFTGLGEFPGVHHIHVDPTVTPVIHGCRNIPLSVQDKLKDTLQDLVHRGVISPVKEPTEWVSSLITTEKKNGTLRVCLDPCDLNKAIKRQHYSIPTPEDVCSNLAGKSIFTILDEKDGCWQIKVDEPSSKLCTFNSLWGRYCFLRFGIKSASEVFQQKNCKTFGDIQGVHIVADNMNIAASTEQEHDEILDKVMERAKVANVRFNGDKIQFKVNTVTYMGHIITPDSLRPHDAKVKAITDMPPPEDKQGLQRLLSMTKYLAQYIPNEASLTAPLRQLLRKDAVWQWNPHHSAALESLKTALTKSPVLRFYDHKKPLTIQADSSKDGLGACLLQEGHPVCYASRALTDTQQRYAQIEKELLAILFATRKFHQYIYGKPVTVQSDHKPLENIMQKQLCKAPARLQRMLLQLQKYELNIAYTPGKHMYIADTLSSANVNREAEEGEDLYDEKVVHGLEATEALSPQTLQQLKEATAADKVLQDLCQKVETGWPLKRRSVNNNLHSYWPMRHRISIENGIVMVGDKIIIPQSFKKVI
ncbi:uncharacterized protein K02A2.6-like [Tachysurus ichikawai]